MALNREIVTFQIGHYANYVGAHWWNIQESTFCYDPMAEPSDINHDILYREGINHQGHTTYTPRLLSIDLKGSLKHLPLHGELYSDQSQQQQPQQLHPTNEQNPVLWDSNKLNVINADQIQKPEFQQNLDNPSNDSNKMDLDLSETTGTWTDFLVQRYHPRSINLIDSFEHSADEESFDCYTTGESVWKDEYMEDEFGDRIRQYIEECNNCQGFQVIFDCTNAFTGIALRSMEYLKDEYAKVNLAIPVFSPKLVNFRQADKALTESIRVVNIAATYAKLFDRSDLILPLSTMGRCWRSLNNPRQFPLVKYAEDNLYETSAILATYLDTISMRYRLKNPTSSNYLSGFCSDLNNYGRQLAGAGLALPFKMNADQDLIDCLDQQTDPLFTQLSPNTKIGTDRIVQSVFVRGIPNDRLKRPLQAAKEQMKMAAYKCDSVSQMLQLYFQCSNYASMAHVASIPNGMATKQPYPIKIFDNQIGLNGFVKEFIEPANDAGLQAVQSIPVLATAQTSADLSETILQLHREGERIKIHRLNSFKSADIQEEYSKDILETLLDIRDIYDDINYL